MSTAQRPCSSAAPAMPTISARPTASTTIFTNHSPKLASMTPPRGIPSGADPNRAMLRLTLKAALLLAYAIGAPCAVWAGESGAPAAFPAVFGAGEAPGASLAAFKRWTGALERALHEGPAYDAPCALRFAGRCTVGEWRQLLQRLADRPRREQIDT